MYRSLKNMTSEPTVNMFMRLILKPGMTFFDCGANVGWLTTVGSRLVGPTGIVVAFEPGPPIDELKEAVRADVCSNTTIVQAAVSASDGVANFQIGENHTVGHLAEEGIPVPTVSLDRYCELNALKPDLVKLDIEGHEAPAIRGMERLIRESPPIIVFEQTADDLSAITLLRAQGYEIISVHDFHTCNDPSQFRGHLQNLAAWIPSVHPNLLFDREQLQDVPFEKIDQGYGASMTLEKGLYIFTTQLPHIHDFANYRIFSEEEGVFSSDSRLSWLSLSYGSIPFINSHKSQPIVQLMTNAEIELPPLKVEKLA